MKTKLLLLPVFGLIVASAACTGVRVSSTSTADYRFPPSTFQETDLIGTWSDGSATETVIVNADRTFKLIYDVPQSGYHYEGGGHWWLEHRQSGCVYVHFERMRFYHATRESAENGNRDAKGTPISFWDQCEARHVPMPDSVIMRVAAVPEFPRGIRLVHLMWELDEADKDLHLVVTSMPTPIS